MGRPGMTPTEELKGRIETLETTVYRLTIAVEALTGLLIARDRDRDQDRRAA